MRLSACAANSTRSELRDVPALYDFLAFRPPLTLGSCTLKPSHTKILQQSCMPWQSSNERTVSSMRHVRGCMGVGLVVIRSVNAAASEPPSLLPACIGACGGHRLPLRCRALRHAAAAVVRSESSVSPTRRSREEPRARPRRPRNGLPSGRSLWQAGSDRRPTSHSSRPRNRCPYSDAWPIKRPISLFAAPVTRSHSPCRPPLGGR